MVIGSASAQDNKIILNQKDVKILQTMNILLPDTIIQSEKVIFELRGGRLGANMSFEKSKYKTFFFCKKFYFPKNEDRQIYLVLPEEKDTFIVLELEPTDLLALKEICGEK